MYVPCASTPMAAAALLLLASCGTPPERNLHAEMPADVASDPEPIPTDDIDRFFWYLATLKSVPVVTFTSLTDAGWPSEVDFVVAFEQDAFVDDFVEQGVPLPTAVLLTTFGSRARNYRVDQVVLFNDRWWPLARFPVNFQSTPATGKVLVVQK